ncbi:hypothetical protein BGZ46_003549 [Entomortierella lignicola]|nr:hypothetical protein BGZ46_003549 [Entomortierella lignicola]
MNPKNSQEQDQNQEQDRDHDQYKWPPNSAQQLAVNIQETHSTTLKQEDQILLSKIQSKIDNLPEEERLRPQLVILYSGTTYISASDSTSYLLYLCITQQLTCTKDTLCPILKYHAELFSEIVRVVPSVIAKKPPCNTNTCDQINDSQLQPNILTIIISPKSDNQVRMILAEPFQLDLFDRRGLADIQVEHAAHSLRKILLVDDTWARLQTKLHPKISRQSADAERERCVKLLSEECLRVESILSNITATSDERLGPVELVCVLDQSESELYGIPAGIHGKVIFVVSKDREERPKAVALKTRIHWIDRIFSRSGYSLDWVHANVIPLYIELPDGPKLNISGQRPESKFEGVGIQLSAKRPGEAHTRVKVRQGQGAEVLEWSVLQEIERTKIFEMQAIRKPPFFLDMMGNVSLNNELVVGGGSKSGRVEDYCTNGDNYTKESNPFL